MAKDYKFDENLQQRLRGIILRHLYRQKPLSDEETSWLRSVDPGKIHSARSEVTHDVYKRMIKKATSTPLFDGDESVPEAEDVFKSLSEWVAYGMAQELGPETAVAYFEEVARDLRLVF